MKTKAPTILPRMTAVGKRRLRKLIAFLRTLKPKQFNFGDVVSDYKKNGHVCGTVCCAIGWTPAVFPQLVRWFESREHGWAMARLSFKAGHTRWVRYDVIANRLFGISEESAASLFHPGRAGRVHESLPAINSFATPKQVAAMLEQYIALTETPSTP